MIFLASEAVVGSLLRSTAILVLPTDGDGAATSRLFSPSGRGH